MRTTVKAHSLWLSASLLAVASVPAGAHSWYPHECCSNYDCRPADAFGTESGGVSFAMVGQHRIDIPSNLFPRTSPDERVHICFRTAGGDGDGSTVTWPICLFLPPQS
jgi:hypothetical protein